MTAPAAPRGLRGIPQIKAWMTPFPYSVEPEAPLAEAREMMAQHGFRHLPVKRGERLVGVISDHALEQATGRRADPAAELKVRDVAAEAFVVDLTTPADRVLLEMAERHVGSVLVTKRGRLAGIFTVTDACRCFGEFLREQFPTPGGDDAA